MGTWVPGGAEGRREEDGGVGVDAGVFLLAVLLTGAASAASRRCRAPRRCSGAREGKWGRQKGAQDQSKANEQERRGRGVLCTRRTTSTSTELRRTAEGFVDGLVALVVRGWVQNGEGRPGFK